MGVVSPFENDYKLQVLRFMMTSAAFSHVPKGCGAGWGVRQFMTVAGVWIDCNRWTKGTAL